MSLIRLFERLALRLLAAQPNAWAGMKRGVAISLPSDGLAGSTVHTRSSLYRSRSCVRYDSSQLKDEVTAIGDWAQYIRDREIYADSCSVTVTLIFSCYQDGRLRSMSGGETGFLFRG